MSAIDKMLAVSGLITPEQRDANIRTEERRRVVVEIVRSLRAGEMHGKMPSEIASMIENRWGSGGGVKG